MVDVAVPDLEERVAELKVIEERWRKLQIIRKLKRRKTFRGYFHAKCNVELDKLFDRFGVPFYFRIPFYAMLHEFVSDVLKSNGVNFDFYWEYAYKKHVVGGGLDKYVSKEVIDGIKEMVWHMWRLREALMAEFNAMQMLKEYELSGKKVDWDTFSLVELEFIDEDKEKEGVG